MGLWSKIKKAAKKVWKAVKGAARVFTRLVVLVLNRLTLGLPDLLLGFIAWPPKKLRLHVFVLWRDPPSGGGDELPPVEQVAQDAIDRTKRLYKDRFNVQVKPYSKTFIEFITDPVPSEALDFKCGAKSEFGDAGDYFAGLLAGWNIIPISLTFPITVFIVRDIVDGALGCSMSVFGDYIVIDREGLMDNVALAHEIGHSCGLWHSGTSSNLMFRSSPAGENVKGFQKNILRSSRHVQYW